MSATGRGAERVIADNYPTPAWCVKRLLETGALPTGGQWIEPCAGEGAIVRVVRPYADALIANDVRDCRQQLYAAGADRCTIEDFTAPATGTDAWRPYTVAITNPPYGVAEAIVRNMLLIADYAAVLVRQGFVGHDRATWMRSDMPDSYDLADRPSFAVSYKCKPNKGEETGCGWAEMRQLTDERPLTCPECGLRRVLRCTSDAADYCWLVWTPERGRTHGRRVILPPSSAEERGVRSTSRARKALT